MPYESIAPAPLYKSLLQNSVTPAKSLFLLQLSKELGFSGIQKHISSHKYFN